MIFVLLVMIFAIAALDPQISSAIIVLDLIFSIRIVII